MLALVDGDVAEVDDAVAVRHVELVLGHRLRPHRPVGVVDALHAFIWLVNLQDTTQSWLCTLPKTTVCAPC